MENKYTIAVFFEEENTSAAQELRILLEDKNIDVCLADDTTADNMNGEQFAEFATDVYAFVFLLTQKSLERDFLKEEIDFAVRNERIIIPVMLENFEFSGAVAHQLSNVQRIFAYEIATRDALRIVADQLKKRIELERTASYSIFEFFAKKFSFELGRLCKKISKKIKQRIAKTKKAKRVLTYVCLFAIIATSAYLYWGLSSSYGWTVGEVHLMSFVPILPGFLIMQLSKLIFGKIKNSIWMSIISIITAGTIFIAMLLTGFGISVYLQM